MRAKPLRRFKGTQNIWFPQRCGHPRPRYDPVSPLQGLSHELFGVGLRGGEHALVVRSLADVAAEDLQDARYRHLTGQLGRVVRGLQVPGHGPAPPPPTVPQVGALVENRRKSVIVAADLALGRLADADALRGTDGAVGVCGPEDQQRR